MHIDWCDAGAADGQRPRSGLAAGALPVPPGRGHHRRARGRRPRSCWRMPTPRAPRRRGGGPRSRSSAQGLPRRPNASARRGTAGRRDRARSETGADHDAEAARARGRPGDLARERARCAALEARACTLAVDIARRLLDRLPARGGHHGARAGCWPTILRRCRSRASDAGRGTRGSRSSPPRRSMQRRRRLAATCDAACSARRRHRFRVDPDVDRGRRTRGPHMRDSQ